MHARDRDIAAVIAVSDPRAQLGNRIGHLNGVNSHAKYLKIGQHSYVIDLCDVNWLYVAVGLRLSL